MDRSYYAIIPANVRYDNGLKANEKLLYGEITSLCNDKGFCWANNEYFAKLYSVTKTSISNWISNLVSRGYIRSEIIYKENTKEIIERRVYITECIKEKLDTPIKEIFNTPIKEIFKDNTKEINNKIIYIVNFLNSTIGSKYKPTSESVKKHIIARLNENFLESDFEEVIKKKYSEWKGTDFEKYLRPETLFGSKFESYLNAKENTNVGGKPRVGREYKKEELNCLFDNINEVSL